MYKDKYKICIVTATRAEYGLLKPLIDRLFQSEQCELQLVVTGAHLSENQGYTVREIEKDGYPICKKIDILVGNDSPVGITSSMGMTVSQFGQCFEEIKPDLVVILGDRYEMLMVASAALIFRIPIAHIHGGETTEGLVDESIRHSISKMSTLHFPTIPEYRNRIIQMGESPDSVYCVGSMGVENIRNLDLLSKSELEAQIEFYIDKNTLLITMHPETLSALSVEKQISGLIEVLSERKDIRGIITKANTDTYGSIINNTWDKFVAGNTHRFKLIPSLGQLRYLSALQFVSAVVGNSSSGIIEVPSFKIPTVNIGGRQGGRFAPGSVLHCGYEKDEIDKALSTALSHGFKQMIKSNKNPYEGGCPSQEIYEIIMDRLNKGLRLDKSFYNLEISL